MRRTGRTGLIVVGSGVAGMYAALCAAEETDVLVLTKGPVSSSASHLAQGGVAAAVGADDDPALHAADTVRARRGLSRPSAVAALTEEAPARVAALLDTSLTGTVPRTRPTPTCPIEPVPAELRAALWQDVGLVRDAEGLERLAGSRHLLARLIARSALARRESRGGHFRTDFPFEDDAFEAHTVIRPGTGERVELERWS